jgi:hypothetical protein
VGDAHAQAHAESIKQLKPIVCFSLNFSFFFQGVMLVFLDAFLLASSPF